MLSAQLALGAYGLLDYFHFTSLFPDHFQRLEVYGLQSQRVVVIQAIGEKPPAQHSSGSSDCHWCFGHGLYLSLFKFSAIGLGLSVLITGLICTTLNRPSSTTVRHYYSCGDGDSKSGSSIESLVNALLRLTESCVARLLLLVVVLWPRPWVRRSTTLEACDRFLSPRLRSLMPSNQEIVSGSLWTSHRCEAIRSQNEWQCLLVVSLCLWSRKKSQ